MPTSPQPILYIGRFAPTPSGPLHSGSLVAALASFLDARSAQGKWLVRIENIDPPREQPGASVEILHTLEAHNLFWDDKVTYQSQRTAIYKDATSTLFNQQLAYYCRCSRLQLKGHRIYPGTCRQQRMRTSLPSAIRVLCNDINIEFDDRIQGPQSHSMSEEVGDFIVYRKDDLPAYQLATAVDDIEQGITHVMRGCDLLDSTPRQMYLHDILGMKSPNYAHIPVLAKEDGQKLSKQNLARPLDLNRCNDNLFQALQLLKQNPPQSLRQQSNQDILDWATLHWSPQNIPSTAVIKKHHPDF